MLNLLKKASAVLLFCLPLGTTASAGGVGDVVKLDILDGGLTSRGTYLGAIRMTLADGWKTYWRAPGEAGIPPQIDWRGSRNVGEVSIIWPAPHVFDQNGIRSVGYKGQMVLPVEITPVNPGQPVRLKGEIDFGVCKDICVPGSFDFDHKLDAAAGPHPAIAAAMAQRPYSAREAGVVSASCRLKPTQDGIQIEAHLTMPPAGDEEVAVIEPGAPELWASETRTRRQGNTLIASSELINASGSTFAVDRSDIRITVLGTKHAVDIRGCAAG
ncbi:hypothetical protein AVO45_11380 [Ruegeria marisrubri]|uniref:Thiol:disulfide interchange protein DsbD N-terminal domain-containing protein n=1 Tax=Ruegeria marisrubri TaxID=1685379 RepID=A0A0X3TKX5_9RHOB|nr:protein-disulfide reductase DsbD domain-containing protein [Ruegeria marisrubri]KUJ76394.1 hypothetical protein AVO45_11380 [Ruegeria marisrubri]